MDFETYSKIKKGNPKAFQILTDTYLKKAWFISYQLTQNSCRGAPLLISAWKESIGQIQELTSTPKEGFREILHSNIFRLYLSDTEEDLDFESLPAPQVAQRFNPFVKEIEMLSDELKPIYLMHTYGNLGGNKIAEIIGKTSEEISQTVKTASEYISEHSRKANRDEWATMIRLSTEFRNPSDSGFNAIEIPEYLFSSLAHEINISINRPMERKEQTNMASKTTSNNTKGNNTRPAKKNNKKNKIITISAIALVAVILGIIFIPKLLNANSGQPTSITTYNVEAISYGDVDTTISGSGTLTPVTKENLTTAGAVTITAVNYEVGATVEEDAVIATAEDANGNEVEYTAPYQCVLLELPIKAENELAAGSQVAMIMGTDGFTMGIAVDELDISTVKVGQEVSFTIDAVDGEYTGSVTAVSYNGTSSGGTTAYQLTATVDYVEGVYPGMSASAEIVIESSGEGLLVPADAVYTSGDDNYIYLAPSGAAEGDEYAEEELDVSTLTKVTVETGMSDGSYILIESDELAEGDLIIITKLTSTMTGSDSDGEGGFGGMGGGGRPGGMGGMDFGDFDFENFDPGNMPQGGGFPGMGGN